MVDFRFLSPGSDLTFASFLGFFLAGVFFFFLGEAPQSDPSMKI